MHYSALLFIMNTHIFAKNNGFYKHSLVYLSYRCSICHQLAKHVIAFAASSSLLHAAHNPLAENLTHAETSAHDVSFNPDD